MQQFVANEVLRLSEPYIPFREGTLIQSGHIENDTDIVWRTPYVRYQHEGKVWIDPKINAAGFKTENGWYSRRGARKIPTDRSLNYNNGSLRGDHWVERMWQNGGKEEVEKGIIKEIGDR